MSEDSVASGALERYRTYDAPPKDFDLLAATPFELRKHGLPPRPDPRLQPKLDEIWRHVVSRSPNYIKAELAIDSVMSGRDPLLRTGMGNALAGGHRGRRTPEHRKVLSSVLGAAAPPLAGVDRVVV